MEKMKLSAPWYTYYSKLCALFGEDPDIKLSFDREEMTIKIYVEGQKKADALDHLLPVKKEFGNVSVDIQVIPANEVVKDEVSILKTAFDGNPVVNDILSTETPITGPTTYVLFANKVVQFFNDDISDYYGNCSTLYQEIASEVLETEANNIFYCTDIPDNAEE